MKNETWEMSTLDWTNRGADGAIVNPVDVGNLIFSQNSEEARTAFYVVSEAVGENGWIYPCALTVVKTILAALPNCCVAAARSECLHLIHMIAASESAPDAQHITEDCMHEIRNAFWYFIYGLQFDDVELVDSYVGVLACLGLKFEDLKCVVIKYLHLVLTRDFPDYPQCYFDGIKNTIAELSE